MGGLLTSGQLAMLFAICGFALGVLLAQHLKDWWNRVPAPLRNEMKVLEKALHQNMALELKNTVARVHAAAGLPNPVNQPPVSPVVVGPLGQTGPVGPS